MKDTEIKACPFCGGEAKLTTTTCDETIDHRHTVICMDGCGGSGQVATSPAAAIMAWNERAGDREPATSQTPEPSTLASATGSAAGDYYIIGLKHSPADGCAIWWRPKCAGYTTNLLEAGRYSEAEINENPSYYNNGETTRAVKCASVEAAIRLTVDWNVMLKAMKQQNAKPSGLRD